MILATWRQTTRRTAMKFSHPIRSTSGGVDGKLKKKAGKVGFQISSADTDLAKRIFCIIVIVFYCYYV